MPRKTELDRKRGGGGRKRKATPVTGPRQQLRLLLEKRVPIPVKRDILNSAHPKVLKAMKRMAGDVLRGRIPITTRELQALKPHKKNLRALGRLKGGLTEMRKIIGRRSQSGGFPFLAALIPAIAAIVGAAKVAAPIAATVAGIAGTAAGIKNLAS